MLNTAVAAGEAADVEFAADVVIRAADAYSGMASRYERFGFDEIASGAKPGRETAASDLLAGTLVDLEIANALMAAGQAVEGGGTSDSAAQLQAATVRLNALTKVVSQGIGPGFDVPAQGGRFGFDEVLPAAPAAPSPNLKTAKAGYESLVTEYLATLIAESKKVVQSACNALVGFGADKLAEAVGGIGKSVAELPRVGKLIAKGLQMAVKAVQKIMELLGSQNAEALRKKAEEIFGQFQQPEGILDKFLAYSYAVAATKDRVKVLLSDTSAEAQKIDGAGAKLRDAQRRFREQMALLMRIVDGVTFSKRLADKFVPETTTILLFGSFYALTMDYAVLASMDYADTAGFINMVEGVVSISELALL